MQDIKSSLSKLFENYRYTHEGTLNGVSNKFILAFGPFILANPSIYIREANELRKNSPVMQFMYYVGYIHTLYNTEVNRKSKVAFVKEFISSVDTDYPETNADTMRERNILLSLGTQAIKHFNTISTENFVTSAAPIVEYGAEIKKQKYIDGVEESSTMKILGSLNSFGTNHEKEAYLYEKFLDNPMDILAAANVYTMDCVNGGDIQILFDILSKKNTFKKDVKLYYFLSLIYYYDINPDTYAPLLKKLEDMFEINKFQNRAAFESMINDVASALPLRYEPETRDVVLEAWEDELDDKPNDYVDKIVDTYKNSLDEGVTDAKYDLNELNTYIVTNRYMEFNNSATNFFTSTVDGGMILNVNTFSDGRVYYEMSNNTIACPFVDLRDYKIRAMVLHGDSNTITITDNFGDYFGNKKESTQ